MRTMWIEKEGGRCSQNGMISRLCVELSLVSKQVIVGFRETGAFLILLL